MTCRNVIALLLAAGLLAGCDEFKRGNYEVQKQLGMYPVDPPRAETPMPPPGSVSQASWAAQRAAASQALNQGNTAPVNYQDPEKLAAEAEAAERAAAAKAPSPATKPPTPAPRISAGRAAPAAATGSAASTAAPAAAPVVVASAPALPAGYMPSPAAVDDPAGAQAAQMMAAATGAAPTPPEMAGSMKDAAAVAGWRAHLASHRTESAAINEWQELLRGNPSLYGQYDPLVEWVDTPARGAFARLVLVGFAERKDADAACAKIRSSTRYCASVKD